MLNKILISLVFICLVVALLYGPKFLRVYKMIHLYDQDKIAFNFVNMDKIFQSGSIIPASDNPFKFKSKEFDLPETYVFEDSNQNLMDALEYYETDGLLILKNDTILYENYWHDNDQSSKHISWSVAKSFLSALIGIAIERGQIENINDPITKYLKDFADTGYENVSIKNLLQMSSGIGFNEDYADYDSDINRFARTISFGTSMREFARSLKNEKPQGTYNHYVSIDTQMLAMLLVEVTNKSISENLKDEIWLKIGMENDAYYMVDDTGMEVALGGLNATLRDYAKFGLLYLKRGLWNGQTVIPSHWVDASHKINDAHLMPGENVNSSSTWGYGYQWWIPGFPNDEYMASGVYNQHIFIDPVNQVVVAKTSSNYKFTQEKDRSKDEHVAMFRAIVSAIAAEG